ncbi:hypothetical protein FPV67DRAFT_271782 [Lyophyllum atratum]|nr:hypothetical protein FPV67DRAFT_271782 [Lyophyllum atratum]
MDGIQGAGRASAFSSTATREAAYLRIQEGIASSKAAIRFWKQYHNELSLISRLPPELLVTVFKYNFGVYGPFRLNWIRVSHVCSHWRRVALGCPSLWSDIPFHRPRWAQEMLARSKMAPLTVMLTFTNSWMDPELLHVSCSEAPAVKATMSQLSRIKKLALHQGQLCQKSVMEVISLLDSPAPLLETLDICFEINGSAKDNRLPDHLFAGDAPRLTHLHIRTGTLNWRALPFSNLKSLEVTAPSFTVDALPDIFGSPPEHVISALSNMPFLEHLKCGSNIAPIGGTSIPCTFIVDLPRLANLEIQSDLHTCIFLLDHITYPGTTHVMVRSAIDVMGERRPVSLSLAQGLANDLIKRAQKPIRCLDLWPASITIETCDGPIQNVAQTHGCQLLLLFDFNNSSDDSVVEIMTDTIQALSTVGHTETLTLQDVSFPQASWINLFGSLNRLKKLRVASNDSTGFLKAFSESSLAMRSQSDHAAHFAFEALRELILSDWGFDQDLNYPEDGIRKSWVDILTDCLKARQEAGSVLQKLVLQDCYHVEQNKVAALRKVVKNLVWDGDPFTTDDEDDDDEEDDNDSDYELEYLFA